MSDQITIQDVVALAEHQRNVEKVITDLENDLRTSKDDLVDISTRRLPNMMLELGLTMLRLSDGTIVQIDDTLYASWPEDSTQAEKYLRETNNDGIIKTKVSVDFGKGEDDRMNEIVQLLTEAGVFANVKSTVHHQTLKKFLREMISKGVGVPLEDFGAEIVKTTKLVLPKP